MNTIEPDTRDWANVLETGCSECGFTGTEDVSAAAQAITDSATAWAVVLARPDAARRLSRSRWSNLEYAAHMRDIYGLFTDRTRLIVAEDDPVLPNFDGDQVALDSDYEHSAPAEVLAGLRITAADYAAGVLAIGAQQWDRTGRRADGRVFTLTDLTRYGLHEIRHHLQDVGIPHTVPQL